VNQVNVGDRLRVSGGYDMEPEWLAGLSAVQGLVVKWIPSGNAAPACVLELDVALTATGLLRSRRETVTGTHLVLAQRYAEAPWTHTGTVHVELCDFVPDDQPWGARRAGAWVESHATYLIV